MAGTRWRGARGDAEQECDGDALHEDGSSSSPCDQDDTLDEPLKNLAHGWSINEKDMMVGYHIGNKFQEPMQGGWENNMRTTLVQSAHGSWTMVEFCEDMTRLLFLDGFFN